MPLGLTGKVPQRHVLLALHVDVFGCADVCGICISVCPIHIYTFTLPFVTRTPGLPPRRPDGGADHRRPASRHQPALLRRDRVHGAAQASHRRQSQVLRQVRAAHVRALGCRAEGTTPECICDAVQCSCMNVYVQGAVYTRPPGCAVCVWSLTHITNGHISLSCRCLVPCSNLPPVSHAPLLPTPPPTACRFPNDVEQMQRIVKYLAEQPGGGATLPDGTLLTPRLLQTLGLSGEACRTLRLPGVRMCVGLSGQNRSLGSWGALVHRVRWSFQLSALPATLPPVPPGLGSGGGFERLHYLLDGFFDAEGHMTPAFAKVWPAGAGAGVPGVLHRCDSCSTACVLDDDIARCRSCVPPHAGI